MKKISVAVISSHISEDVKCLYDSLRLVELDPILLRDASELNKIDTDFFIPMHTTKSSFYAIDNKYFYNDATLSIMVEDRAYLKQILRKNGLSSIVCEAYDFANPEEIQFPVVVKPRFPQSGNLEYYIKDREYLNDFVFKADSVESLSKQYIIEEYVSTSKVTSSAFRAYIFDGEVKYFIERDKSNLIRSLAGCVQNKLLEECPYESELKQVYNVLPLALMAIDFIVDNDDNIKLLSVDSMPTLEDLFDIDVDVYSHFSQWIKTKVSSIDERTYDSKYGRMTKMSLLPISTSFFVQNGNWEGEIVLSDGLKCVKVFKTGDIIPIQDDSYNAVTITTDLNKKIIRCIKQ